jgi:hypothetical protein
MIPLVAVLTVSTTALAQESGSGSSERPTGFSIEVGLAASTSLYNLGFFDIVLPGVSMAPQLAVGAQLGRLSLALTTSVSVVGQSEEDPDGDEVGSNLWTVRLGPYVDGEIWGSGRVALFLYGGIDLLIYRDTDVSDSDLDSGSNGFSIDVGLGGRVYVFPQFSIGLKLGTSFDMAFYQPPDGLEDNNERTLSWALYGALAFRFVAAR